MDYLCALVLTYLKDLPTFFRERAGVFLVLGVGILIGALLF